jgi:hypothetical protein
MRDVKGGKSSCLAFDRAAKGTVPIKLKPDAEPAFHALPVDAKESPPGSVPLYEFVHRDGRQRFYSTDKDRTQPDYTRSAEPVARVWPNPLSVPLPAR